MSNDNLAPAARDSLILQGDIKIRLIANGVEQEQAHDLAGEIMDDILKSDIVKPEVRTMYEIFNKKES